MATRVSLEEARKKAEKYFGLELPVSMETLKKAFRAKAFALHQDKVGDDSKNGEFVEMKEAYDYLNDVGRILDGIFTDCQDESPATTVEGIPLSELGLGLGPTTNGALCQDCQGEGYKTNYGTKEILCTECDSWGQVPKTYPCRPCQGTGRFTQRRSGREVDCRKCHGTGLFTHPYHTKLCPECHGSKVKYVDDNRPFYNQCWACNGTGEIEILNPVLQKGALNPQAS